MPLSLRSPILSSRGRIARAAFLGNLALLLAAFLALFILIAYFVDRDAGLLALPALVWGTVALAARRLHDTGRSAWWLLALLVPLLGPLWLAGVLCCQRGVAAENRFGADPLRAGFDYHSVKFSAISGAE